MKLSDHFTLEEMTFSETAVRNHIDNTPLPAQQSNMEHLAESLLEPIHAAFGMVRVTSGYRCLAVNRLVGSKDTSAHVDGRAADIQTASMRPLAFAHAILELDLPFDQLIHEFGSWVHIGMARAGDEPRRQLLTIDKHGTRAGLLEIRS